MKVLLIAEPPRGDHAEQELSKRGFDVVYKRGLKPAAMVEAVGPGYDWVLVMNGNSLGAALKEKARRLGARYVSLPPGWSLAEKVLREQGFPLGDAPPTLTEPTLTHRPLAALGQPKITEVPASSPPAPAPEPAPAAAPPTDRGARILALAREAFTRDPRLFATAFAQGLRKAGTPIPTETLQDIFRIRREVRAAAGLPPSGREGFKIRKDAVTRPEPRVPARPVSAAADGLPTDIMAAAELLAQALRTEGVAGWVKVADDGAVDFDAEVRVVRKFSGSARVGAA